MIKKGVKTMTALRERVVAELIKRAEEQGNGYKITTKRNGKDMWIWFQNDGKYAIYFDDGNVWRDRTKDVAPKQFNTIEDMAEYIIG